jgi:hypothetical protein
LLSTVLFAKEALALNWSLPDFGMDNFKVQASGHAELLDDSGKVVKTLAITRLATFTYEGKAVKYLRVSVEYSASGVGVDWSTLQVVLNAEGTGGWTKQITSNKKSDVLTVEMPLTTDLLEKTPSHGEEVIFVLHVKLSASIKDVLGKTLTAESWTASHGVKLKWHSPTFEVDANDKTVVITDEDDTYILPTTPPEETDDVTEYIYDYLMSGGTFTGGGMWSRPYMIAVIHP